MASHGCRRDSNTETVGGGKVGSANAPIGTATATSGVRGEEWWSCSWTSEFRRYKITHAARPILVLSDIFTRPERMRPSVNVNLADYGVMDEIHVDLDPAQAWSVTLAVSSSRDFGARERRMLSLLRPHLVASYRAAELRRRLATTAAALGRNGYATAEIMSSLTARDRDVMQCVADGLLNAEIATALVVELSTVRKHLDVFAKLGVRSRTAAVAKLRA
jgi:DNA-binding CsgD family transcriptional regulator